MLPVTPDPSKMWKMQRGTWLHEMVGLSLGENNDWWTEEVDEGRCVYEGELFGVPMSCKIDAMKKDYSVLMDWKFRADGAERWIDPQRNARIEDSAQLNMARMLIGQQTKRDTSEMSMYVWVMAGETVRTSVQHMSEGQIGAVRPGGGEYTVEQIFTLLSGAMNDWQALDEDAADEEKHKIVAALPMVGKGMFKSKRNKVQCMCTHYCEVQEECYAIEGLF